MTQHLFKKNAVRQEPTGPLEKCKITEFVSSSQYEKGEAMMKSRLLKEWWHWA
jgi:hypothetical protein